MQASAPTETAANEPKQLHIKRTSITEAFEVWEKDFRDNPSNFYTAAESAAMEVATISEARAIHFIALLRKVEAA